MVEHFKYPNPNNSGMGQSFCKNADCKNHSNCVFAFNSVLGGREMRLDFNLCNLSCVLCWSNNNAPNIPVDSQDIISSFIYCVTRKDKYLENQYPKGVKDDASFKTRGLQIIGGEPFKSRERFLFVIEILEGINRFVQQDVHSIEYLNLNRKGKFKIKIFTNGVSIGENTISNSDLYHLGLFEGLDIRILLSLKGLNENATNQLQSKCNYQNLLNLQVNALEKLMCLPKNVKLEPVLGFYHSADFNIKTPELCAEKMFAFDPCDPVSTRLKVLLKNHIANKEKIYVEPVHSVPQSKKGKEDFYSHFREFLEKDCLIEPYLKGGTRKNINDTLLVNIL